MQKTEEVALTSADEILAALEAAHEAPEGLAHRSLRGSE